MMPIVMVMASMSISPMSSMISSESTIVVVTIVFVVISPIVAVDDYELVNPKRTVMM